MKRKNHPPAPTESELAILKVLWRRGPCSVREVWEEIAQKTGYTTTLKQMQIMYEKGLVTRDERSVTHFYASAVPEQGTKEKIVTGLIDRVFDGSASALVQRALSAKPVSPAELRAIRELLDKAEEKRE